jgi:hypothetical protein
MIARSKKSVSGAWDTSRSEEQCLMQGVQAVQGGESIMHQASVAKCWTYRVGL